MPRSARIRIHIGHHFFGAGNIGDDLMLSGFERALAPFRDEFLFTCCIPRDAVSQLRRFPFIQWRPYSMAERDARIAECEAWLGLGSSPFQSDSGAWFTDHLREEAELCHRHKKAMYFLGVGVNDCEALENPVILVLLQRARRIWTRDRHSLELIVSACPQSRVVEGGDLANLELAVRPPVHLASDQVGFILNFETLPLNFMVDFIPVALHTPGRILVWMRQEVRRFAWSESTLMDLLPHTMRDVFIQREADYEKASLDDLLQTLSGTGALVTSRYHAALVGAWQGSRVIVYCRNEKLRGLASQLNIKTFDRFTVQAIESALAGSRRVDETLLARTAAKARAAAEECLLTMRELALTR